jgi:hypothetical protein
MKIQMRLITSDNIENLTSYGKHSLGNLNKFIERAENFVEVEKEKEPSPKPLSKEKTVTINPTELDANEQKALIHDIERLKKNNIYSPEEEEKSKQSILDLKTQLKEGNITQDEYKKLLIPETNEPVSTSENESTNESQSENENMTQSENESQSENEESGELKEYNPPVTESNKIIKLN